MHRYHDLTICTFLATCLLLAASGSGQRTAAKTGKSASDTGSVPQTKTSKMISQAGTYTQMAGDVKTKLKSLFPSKAGDTVFFVIPNITYSDPNLKAFKQKLSALKNTKNMTSGYKNNTAVVKILFKGGDASTLYDQLDDGIKEIFVPEDMEGARAILNYKNGADPGSNASGKSVTATKVN